MGGMDVTACHGLEAVGSRLKTIGQNRLPRIIVRDIGERLELTKPASPAMSAKSFRFNAAVYRALHEKVQKSWEDFSKRFSEDDLLELSDLHYSKSEPRVAAEIGFKRTPDDLPFMGGSEQAYVQPPGEYRPTDDFEPHNDIYMSLNPNIAKESKGHKLHVLSHELTHVFQLQNVDGVSHPVGSLVDDMTKGRCDALAAFKSKKGLSAKNKALPWTDEHLAMEARLKDTTGEDLASLKWFFIDEIEAHRASERYVKLRGCQTEDTAFENAFHEKWNRRLLYLIGQEEQRRGLMKAQANFTMRHSGVAERLGQQAAPNVTSSLERLQTLITHRAKHNLDEKEILAMAHPDIYDDAFLSLLGTDDLSMLRRISGNSLIPLPSGENFAVAMEQLSVHADPDIAKALFDRLGELPPEQSLALFDTLLQQGYDPKILMEKLTEMPEGTVASAFKQLFAANISDEVKGGLCKRISSYPESERQEIITYLKDNEDQLGAMTKFQLNKFLGEKVFSSLF